MSKNIRTRLTTTDGQRVEYSAIHGFENAPGIPCFRCGVCCVKWQPPVDSEEARTLAQGLGLSHAAFTKKYLQKYPGKEGYLIRRENNACVFLKFENGVGGCSVHQFRPEACRNWNAGLEKTECQEGLRRMGKIAALVTPTDLPFTQDDILLLYRALTGPPVNPSTTP